VFFRNEFLNSSLVLLLLSSFQVWLIVTLPFERISGFTGEFLSSESQQGRSKLLLRLLPSNSDLDILFGLNSSGFKDKVLVNECWINLLGFFIVELKLSFQ
jgi:hypothetical protein